MLYEVSDYNYFENNIFYIKFRFLNNNTYKKTSYESIYSKYLKSNIGNKSKLDNEDINNINPITSDYNENNEQKIKISFKNINDIFFAISFEGIKGDTPIFKEKRKISIKNKNNELKIIKVFNINHISKLMKQEGLDSTNSIIKNEKGKIINVLDYAHTIEYKTVQKVCDPFQIYTSLNKDDKREYTLNFEDYFRTKNFKYIKTEARTKFYNYLKNFIDRKSDEKNILFLTGISGIGKSISLLHFISENNRAKCYFNMNFIHNYYNDKYISNEAFKLFDNNEINNNYNNLIQNMKLKSDYWDKIEFILASSYDMTSKIIIFDQYKESYDHEYKNILKFSSLFPSYKFIICSSINDNSLREQTILSCILKMKIKFSIDIYYIEDNLCNMKELAKSDEEDNFFSLFNYLPKFYNYFYEIFENYSKENGEKFIEICLDKYKASLDKFYYTKNLCYKFKLIQYYILSKKFLSKKELTDIIELLPLKYIKIIKKQNIYLIEYAFPFISYVFKDHYFKELYEISHMKIINNRNKRGEIGTIIDDLVNFQFNVDNEVFNNKIDYKIIIDSILDLDEIYCVFDHNNINEEIIFEIKECLNYRKENSENKTILMDKLVDGKKVIYLYQYTQGKNYDGAILFPIPDHVGSYELFLYQTTINKDKRFFKNDILRDCLKIKEKLYEIFGIEIVNFYFSYILLYEDKDLNTINHCKNEYLRYFFYSLNDNKFVEENNDEVKCVTDNKSIICQKELQFSEIKKNIIFFEKCFNYKKNNENKKFPSDCFAKIYLGKKIMFSKIKNKKENGISKKNNLINLNYLLKKKINELTIDKSVASTSSIDIEEEMKSKLSIQELENEKLKLIAKLKSLTKRNDEYDILDENNNIKNSKNQKMMKKEEDEIKYNVKKQMTYQIMPEKIKKIFPDYNKYREYGHHYLYGFEYPEFPFIIVCKKNDNIEYIEYLKKNKKVYVNAQENKELTDDKKIQYFNQFFTGNLSFHLYELST